MRQNPFVRSALKRLALAVSLFVVLLVSANGAGATSTQTINFSENLAQASFSSVGSTGCVYTDAYVFGTDRTYHGEKYPSDVPTKYVLINQYDYCTGFLLRNISFFAPLEPGALFIDPNLTSARLDTTIDAFDWASGQTVSVVIHLRWYNSAAPSGDTRTQIKLRYSDESIYGFIDGVTSPASASGTVTINGENFTPNPSGGGPYPNSTSLSRVRRGSVDITFS